MRRTVHILVWVALAVVLVVNVASAYVRLAQQGIGCTPWPQCYGRTAPQDAGAVPSEDAPHFYMRALHRFSASVAAVLLLAIAFLGWSGWRGAGPRIAAVALLALAGGLTWLGVRTPSAAPAVTLGNVLGGMAMLALLAWLAAWRPQRRLGAPAVRDRLSTWAGLALALVVVQAALGALVNARYGAGACSGLALCGGSGWPLAWTSGAFDIFRPSEVPILAAEATSREAVHMAHRFAGAVTAILVAVVAVAALRGPDGPRGAAALTLLVLATQLGLGAYMVSAGVPLAAATLHNAGANLLLATLAWLYSRLGEP